MCGYETWTKAKAEGNKLLIFEPWYWRSKQKMYQREHKTYEKVFQKAREHRNFIQSWKKAGHVL